MSIDVDFFHYECVIDEKKDPKPLNTPHFSETDRKERTFDLVSSKFNLVKKGKLNLSKNLIFLKNLALSESVYIDPLKDFQEYEKWKDGKLKFPFFGKHLPLEIDEQDKKAASTQIKGTIGEIIAGTFFEGYFNGRIIVRPIYKYPDFIGWLSNTGFGYCESKCNDFESVKNQLDQDILGGRVPKNDLKQLITDVIRELSDEKDLTIFLSFSLIDSYKPSKIKHTVLELYTKHRVNSLKSSAPEVLGVNILEDVFKEKIQELSEHCKRDENFKKKLTEEGDSINSTIKESLKEKISNVETLANIKGKLSKIVDFEDLIDKFVKEKKNKKLLDKALNGEEISDIKFVDNNGKNLTDWKIKAMEMEKIGEYENKDIYRQMLDLQSLIYLESQPWQIPKLKDSDYEFYICGNALIGLVNKEIKNPPVIKLDDKRWEDLALS